MTARRGFLGTLAGLFVAPWLKPTPHLDWIPDDSPLVPIIPDTPAKAGETLYYLPTKYFHMPCENLSPRVSAIITDIRDPYDLEMGEPPIKTTKGLKLLSEQTARKQR